MQIQRVEIQNFRALQSIDVELEKICVLIGENDVGKTSFLHALDKYFIGKKISDSQLWFKHDTSKNIIIILTFDGIQDEELDTFRRKDGSLRIIKTFEFDKAPTVEAILEDDTIVKITKPIFSKWFSSDRFHFIPVHRDLSVQFSMGKTALLGKTLRTQMKKSLVDEDASRSLNELRTILGNSIDNHRIKLESFLQEQLHDDNIKLGFEDLEIDPVEE